MLMTSLSFPIIVKLGISALIGMVIGLERELKRKPLGLRTCAVIALSSCLLTIVSIETANAMAEAYRLPMDPLRLAAQVVSGVGFLGAGVILRRNNDVISGLTTAAMIWGAAAAGIAVGANMWPYAAITTIFILVSVQLLPLITKWAGPQTLKEREMRVKIHVSNAWEMTDFIKHMNKNGYKLERIKVEDTKDQRHILECSLYANESHYITDIYYDIHSIDCVEGVKIEAL